MRGAGGRRESKQGRERVLKFSKGHVEPPLVLLCSACLHNLQSDKHTGGGEKRLGFNSNVSNFTINK